MKKFLVLSLLLILYGCGGESGSRGGTSSGARISASTNELNVAASNIEITQESLTITLSNLPDNGIFIGARAINTLTISELDIFQTAENRASLFVNFPVGGSLSAGVHENSIEVLACIDENCNQQISGSPLIITTKLTVTKGRISVSQTNIDVTRSKFDRTDSINRDISEVLIDMTGESLQGLTVYAEYEQNGYNQSPSGISELSVQSQIENSKIRVEFNHLTPEYLNAGTYSDTIYVKACYDPSCNYHVPGSPLEVTSNYTINYNPPSDIPIASIPQRKELNHNIIDAEYSDALNAIVMVSSQPENALYIYDTVTNQTKAIHLDLVPTAVSVANLDDGKRIAIGHDARITVIDVDAINHDVVAKNLLNTSIDVFDLVIKDDAVYAISSTGQWSNLSQVTISNNQEMIFTQELIREHSTIKLDASGNSLYVNDDGNSFNKFSIEGGVLSHLYRSDYTINYNLGDRLWMSEDGKKIYTTTGNTYLTSTTQSQDMKYSGLMALGKSTDDFFNKRVISVSDSKEINEVAVVERDFVVTCEIDSFERPCFADIRRFDNDFLTDKGVYGLPAFIINNEQFIETPKYVFHNAAGTRLFALSTLLGAPTQQSYVIELAR